MTPFRYRIVTAWSDEDQAYIARVPALGSTCSADGPTPQKAAKEVQIVAELFLESLAEDGDPIPPPDADQEFAKVG